MIKLLTVNSEAEAIWIKSQLESHGVKVVLTTSNESFLPGIIGVHNGPVPYDSLFPKSALRKQKKSCRKNQRTTLLKLPHLL